MRKSSHYFAYSLAFAGENRCGRKEFRARGNNKKQEYGFKLFLYISF